MARSTASELPETQLCLVGKKCFFVVTCWVWLLGMAVGYGKPQRFDWGRTSRDQQLLYWSSVGDTELRVSEMVGELKVSLSRWRILAWDFIWFCYKLYIYIWDFSTFPLMCGIWAFFLGHRFLLYHWCGPPKTWGRQSRLSQQMELKRSQPMEFGA